MTVDPPMPRFSDPDNDPEWRGDGLTRCQTCGEHMTYDEFWDHVGTHDGPNAWRDGMDSGN